MIDLIHWRDYDRSRTALLRIWCIRIDWPDSLKGLRRFSGGRARYTFAARLIDLIHWRDYDMSKFCHFFRFLKSWLIDLIHWRDYDPISVFKFSMRAFIDWLTWFIEGITTGVPLTITLPTFKIDWPDSLKGLRPVLGGIVPSEHLQFRLIDLIHWRDYDPPLRGASCHVYICSKIDWPDSLKGLRLSSTSINFKDRIRLIDLIHWRDYDAD